MVISTSMSHKHLIMKTAISSGLYNTAIICNIASFNFNPIGYCQLQELYV